MCASSSRLASSGSRLPPLPGTLSAVVEGEMEGGGGRGARGGATGGARAGTELARCSASAAPAGERASSATRRESENFLRFRLSAASAVSGCSGPLRVTRSGLRCESLPESDRSLPLR